MLEAAILPLKHVSEGGIATKALFDSRAWLILEPILLLVGGRVVLVPLFEGRSTSELVRKITG